MLQKTRSKSRELLSRLEKLDRRKVLELVKTGTELEKEGSRRPAKPVREASALVEPIVYRRDLPRQVPHFHSAPVLERMVILEEAIAGQVVELAALGHMYFIECFPCEEIATLRTFPAEFASLVQESDSSIRKNLRACGCEPDELRAEDILFLDLETTGLGSCPLFLIGTMEWDHGALIVRQYLARNYAEEAAAIGHFMQRTVNRKLLVSFNGKSFDAPFLRMRAAANGIQCVLPDRHLDLLHHSRRVWKGKLPDCRLQTLELHICGRGRYGDIPGALIPDAYHEFVRTSNAVKLVEILKHNMLDMVTLADLMVRMPAAEPKAILRAAKKNPAKKSKAARRSKRVSNALVEAAG